MEGAPLIDVNIISANGPLLKMSGGILGEEDDGRLQSQDSAERQADAFVFFPPFPQTRVLSAWGKKNKYILKLWFNLTLLWIFVFFDLCKAWIMLSFRSSELRVASRKRNGGGAVAL